MKTTLVCRMLPRMIPLAVCTLTLAPSVRAQRAPVVDAVVADTRTTVPSRDETFARPITLKLDRVSLKAAVDAIASTAEVRIHYRTELLAAVTAPVSLDASKQSLGAVLRQVLAGTSLRAQSSIANVVTIQPSEDDAVAQGTITGKVVHAKTKQPIVGATILLDDASKGVLTGDDGSFRLPASVGEHTVHVRMVGFTKQTKRVTVSENMSATLEFRLEPSTSVLSEVVVTGTVVATERKALPTPITVITAQDIEKRGITRVEQLFRGEVPGVIALDQGSATYSATAWMTGGDSLGQMSISKVYARGSSTLSGKPNPLKIYIDGVEMLNPAYLATLDPKGIERIEIITGPQAATIYGSGAMGGVMQIFTKKGNGERATETTVSLRYGMLQNSVADGLTPTHNDAINVTGGTGPNFSYAATASYDYTGQWQPKLFNRMFGGSVGVNHTTGPLTASATLGATAGRNGTTTIYSTRNQELIATGVWRDFQNDRASSQRVGTSSTLTGALNVDLRATRFWQNHLTIGQSQTDLGLIPQAANRVTTSDSLMQMRSSTGKRLTASYNATFTGAIGRLSPTLVMGVSGTSGNQTSIQGGKLSNSATSLVNSYVTQSVDDRSWGMFSQLQLGFWDQLYLTLGIRGERSPSYGTAHAIDWTPTNGLAYTVELKDLTVKLLGSYGRSTRAPTPGQRDGYFSFCSSCDPAVYPAQLDAPDLTPEYARGPQMGMELYYGNLGSLTINHYRQTVTDLIQGIKVDSVLIRVPAGGYEYYGGVYQYRNVAKIRQQGWEATGSANLWMLNLRGTYSWNDSRILHVAPNSGYDPGSSFLGVPTHTGSITTSYAHGPTTVSVVVNYIGASPATYQASMLDLNRRYSRDQMYIERKNSNFGLQWPGTGYMKSDLSASQRLTPWATATLNVLNLANGYGADAVPLFPTLGRQTMLGMSLRFPRR